MWPAQGRSQQRVGGHDGAVGSPDPENDEHQAGHTHHSRPEQWRLFGDALGEPTREAGDDYDGTYQCPDAEQEAQREPGPRGAHGRGEDQEGDEGWAGHEADEQAHGGGGQLAAIPLPGLQAVKQAPGPRRLGGAGAPAFGGSTPDGDPKADAGHRHAEGESAPAREGPLHEESTARQADGEAQRAVGEDPSSVEDQGEPDAPSRASVRPDDVAGDEG